MSERYSAGVATAYGAALRGGYTGTYNDFCNDVAKLGNITEELGSISAEATTLEAGSSATASYNEGVFAFGIPRGNTGAQGERGETGAKGDKGDTGETGATGATGNGIASIAKTGTSGLVDTYTITFTDGTTTTFDVTNGTAAIDTTLSIAGKAADAKATGDAVNDLKEDLSDISATVETLIPETLTLSVGLMSKYGTASSTTMYENGSLQVSPQERYQIDAFYYGGNFPAVVFFGGTSVVSFINGTGDRTEYSDIVTVPNNADTMVINGRTADIRAKASKEAEKKVIKIQSGSAVEVGKDASRYEYTDINTAIVNNADSIVSVDYGTYETEIQNLTTNKRIVGKDVDLCILTGTNKDYDTPPIEIAGGVIKNFTVKMVNDENASHKGYCLHSDNAATANNTLLVENCKFICIGQHTVGIGLRPDETLIFENCYFEQLDDATDMNPIYIHNATGANPAIVKFHNCYFRGHEHCMKLQGWGSGNPVKFEFINCTCLSDTYGVADDCVWTDYVSGSTHDTNRLHEFSGKFTLLPTSHGNNIAVLNSN